jgi:phosphoglycerate kinase
VRRILKNASQGNYLIHLLQDVLVAWELTPHPISLRTISIQGISIQGVAAVEMILDLGPLTVVRALDVLRSSQLLIWN